VERGRDSFEDRSAIPPLPPTGPPLERLIINRLLIRRMIPMNCLESFSKWCCDSDWVSRRLWYAPRFVWSDFLTHATVICLNRYSKSPIKRFMAQINCELSTHW
jgi:hypothetical protein